MGEGPRSFPWLRGSPRVYNKKERKERSRKRSENRNLERLFEYLKRSLTIARKSIFFNFKQYVFFFVALLIVQMFYGIMTISAYNNDVVERASAENVYDYDLTLTHLNESQYFKVTTYAGSEYTKSKFYTVLDDKTVEYKDGGDTYYDIKLRFKDDISTSGL